MIRIYITRQSRYPADTRKLKERVRSVFAYHGVKDSEASVALVGERKMRDLGKRYLGETETDETHEVLSFSSQTAHGEFIKSEDDSLGDIVICYPKVREIAIKKNRLMDEVIGELAEHGALHLLGLHHE